MSGPNKYAADIVRLHKAGWTGAAIARELGCSQVWVSEVRERNGLRPKKRARGPRSTNPRHVSFGGNDLADPKRADKLLRRFSFEDRPADDVRPRTANENARAIQGFARDIAEASRW